MSNLLDKASVILTPTAYNTSEALCVKPSDGTGDFDFSRATEATRINSLGLVETIGINLPRINYEGGCGSWLWEPQSTNLYLNSETLSTQTITTAANQYSVSFYGTGTITFSGTHTGSLIGTGLNNRVTATFTATSGTLTSTISGIVTKAQIEQLNYATSYIPTSGSTVTRNKDLCTNGGSLASINSPEGVLYIEAAALAAITEERRIVLSDGTNTYRVIIRITAPDTIKFFVGVVSNQASHTATGVVTTNFNRMAISWKENDIRFYLNGTNIFTDTSSNPFPADTLNILNFSSPDGSSNPFFGKTKCAAIWKEALTDAELISLTTL